MSQPGSAPKTVRLQYLRSLQAAILRHGLYRENVHANAVVSALPVAEVVHPNTIGAAFSGLETAGLIQAVGFERSGRRSRHRGVSRIWRVCDQAGAREYLRALATSGVDLSHL